MWSCCPSSTRRDLRVPGTWGTMRTMESSTLARILLARPEPRYRLPGRDVTTLRVSFAVATVVANYARCRQFTITEATFRLIQRGAEHLMLVCQRDELTKRQPSAAAGKASGATAAACATGPSGDVRDAQRPLLDPKLRYCLPRSQSTTLRVSYGVGMVVANLAKNMKISIVEATFRLLQAGVAYEVHLIRQEEMARRWLAGMASAATGARGRPERPLPPAS